MRATPSAYVATRTGRLTITAAPRTASAPSNWTAPSASPKVTNTSATVTGGSSVLRIAALDGPTRLIPLKNKTTARTVDTSEASPSQSQPSVAKPKSSEPVPAATSPSVTIAPVDTSAASGSGSRLLVTPSETRM